MCINIDEEWKMVNEKHEDRRKQVPLWEKYSLTIEEAAIYFRLGENKLRAIIRGNPTADFILWNGNRPQIKRKRFECYLDNTSSV